MTATGFLGAALITAGAALAVTAWLTARANDRTAPTPRPAPVPDGAGGRDNRALVDDAYATAVTDLRQLSRRQVARVERNLRADYARRPLTAGELVELAAARTVLLTGRTRPLAPLPTRRYPTGAQR